MIGYYLVIFLNNLFLRAKILIKSDISKFYIHVSHVSSLPSSLSDGNTVCIVGWQWLSAVL